MIYSSAEQLFYVAEQHADEPYEIDIVRPFAQVCIYSPVPIPTTRAEARL